MYTYELLWKNNEIFEDHKNGYPIYFDFIYRWENRITHKSVAYELGLPFGDQTWPWKIHHFWLILSH